MALIQDLIKQIDDQALRDRLMAEVDKLSKQKKFGLVFEEHLPECTPLYDVKIRKDSKVALKTGQVSDIYIVRSINGDKAICEHRIDHTEEEFTLNDLVAVAEFGEPIYPYLKPIDTVCNAPDSDLWHTLIEADNYHALQLLEYLYAGKVDCIYIDPPYNTGAKDWKYNNNYVDSADAYRHSKWLSMMKKRLIIAKKLLNPADSVLIVTIDEKEYLHLGCLLEDLFPEATLQMVTAVINPKGRATNYFTRTDEYLFFLFFGKAEVIPFEKESGTIEVRWPYLKRSDADSTRGHRPRQFYPIYINDKTGKIESIGTPIDSNIPRESVPIIDGCTAVFPINEDGTEMEWGLTAAPLKELNDRGFVCVGKKRKNNPMPYSISYLSTADLTRIEQGLLKVIGTREDGTKIVVSENGKQSRMQTVWTSGVYDAGAYGKTIIGNIVPKHNFQYPKSLYAVHDTLKNVISNKTNALIVDFFAGSGTTLHAVNLLNAEDGGKRRCILVTNNEVYIKEAETLAKNGYKPGDFEWERFGIAHYITWPRTVCSIEGRDVNGEMLEGEYITSQTVKQETMRSVTQIKFIDDISSLKIGDKKQLVTLISNGVLPQNLVGNETKYIVSDESGHTVSILFDETAVDEYLEALEGMTHITDFFIITKKTKIFKTIKDQINETLGSITVDAPVKMPMSEGFKANVAFFKLGFLDKASVRIGRQFREMLPILWMKAGCFGSCPTLEGQKIPEYMVSQENHMAILNDSRCFAKFAEEIGNTPEIETVYLVTDSDADYRNMSKGLNAKQTYQLYRDYLDNFRINSRR